VTFFGENDIVTYRKKRQLAFPFSTVIKYYLMSSSLVYACGEEVFETEIDGEIVLMSIGKGEYYSLDEVASRIWELLKSKPMNIDSLCMELQEEFEIDSTTCRLDTQEFLAHMVEKTLIDVVRE
jgi:Zn-dependent M32 family carboxypeptidase